ncbi:MAG TPA: lipid II flippase MurJ, partial [Gammaproteobacteria bacterium]|nr:lipid II flippase MurJ [Gammaproteobacteria bacterium]
AAASVMAYAVGLLGFTLVKVVAPGFYARQDTRTPVKVGVISVIANLVLNAVITIPWAMLGYVAPHAGLALSTSLAAFVNAGLLYWHLRRHRVYQPAQGWRALLGRALLANAVMAVMLWLFAGNLGVWLQRTALERSLWLAFWIVLAALVYFAVLFGSGFRLRDLRNRTA